LIKFYNLRLGLLGVSPRVASTCAIDWGVYIPLHTYRLCIHFAVASRQTDSCRSCRCCRQCIYTCTQVKRGCFTMGLMYIVADYLLLVNFVI